jgi:hypothetical protein
VIESSDVSARNEHDAIVAVTRPSRAGVSHVHVHAPVAARRIVAAARASTIAVDSRPAEWPPEERPLSRGQKVARKPGGVRRGVDGDAVAWWRPPPPVQALLQPRVRSGVPHHSAE